MNQEFNIKDLKEIELENIKAIFIDIDDTLYSYKETHPLAINSCYNKYLEYFGKDLEISLYDQNQFAIRYRKARDAVTDRLFPGSACRSRLLAFKDMFEEIPALSNISAYEYALEFEEIYWSSLIKNIEPNKEMKSFLEFCRKRTPEIKICAISDMQTAYQIRKLSKLGYADFFLITSEEVGVEKPNAKIFRYALEKFNLNAEEVIMIGDNLIKDIEGASKLGIRSYLVNLND